MADKKITQLTNITGANLVDADEFVVVDISADETKAITLGELKEAFDSGSGFVRITGDTMTGDLALSGADVTFGDNDKAIFGAGSGDFEIYSDGTFARIMETGGNFLVLDTNGSKVSITSDNSKEMGNFVKNGAVELHHNGFQKFSTTSTGIDVTGTVTADGLTVDGIGLFTSTSAGNVLEIKSTDTGAASGPDMVFYREATGADSDVLGRLRFYGQDSSSNLTEYAFFDTSIEDASNGTEDGKITFNVKSGGANREYLSMVGSSYSVFNDGGLDIDFRVASYNNANMIFANAGLSEVGINTSITNAAFAVQKANGPSPTLRLLGDNTNSVTANIRFQALNSGGTNRYADIVFEPDISTGAIQFYTDYGYSTADKALQLDAANGAIFNDGGSSTRDFRVESVSNEHMLFVDAGKNSVKINSNSTTYDGGAPFQIGYNATTFYGPQIQTDNRTYVHYTGAGGGSANNTYIHGYQIDNPAAGGYLRVAPGLSNNIVSGVQQSQNGLLYVWNSGKATGDADYTPTISHQIDFGTGGNVVFNKVGANIDFRVESDSQTNMFVIDAAENKIGIGRYPQSSGSGNNLIEGAIQVNDTVGQVPLFLNGGADYAGFKIRRGNTNAAGGAEDWNLTVRPSYGNGVAAGPDVSFIRAKTPFGGQMEVVVNDDSYDSDFRVASDSFSNAILVDASQNFIGFNGVSSAPWGQTTGEGRMVYRLNQGSMSLTNNRNTGYSNLYINKFGTGSDNRGIAFYHDGNGSGVVDITSSGVTYNTTSDRRLKDNIEPIANGTEKLMAMKPVTHTWKADPEADAVHGFIAQEMQEVVPEAVSGEPDGEEMMSMDYGRITPVLVAALQDAHNKITALETRLAEMEAK